MANDKPPSVERPKLQFHYLKSQDYREVACHGVFGGHSPRDASIWMAVFSERTPIPRMVEYEFPESANADATIEEGVTIPSFVDSRQGIVRYVDFCTYMSLDTARRVHKWLGEQLENASPGGEKE